MAEAIPEWERIESVVKWANLSTNSFAKHIGFTRSEALYQIKRGNNGISRKVAERIVEHFPSISLIWLLTGLGDMFSGPELKSCSRPLFNLNVEEAIRDVTSLTPDSYMVLPSSIDCDLAMLYLGRAMSSVTPPNSILLLKRILPDMIIPGDECVVVTKKLVLLRYIKINEATGDEHRFRLVAADSENFGDVLVETHEIESLFRVEGKILINR